MPAPTAATAGPGAFADGCAPPSTCACVAVVPVGVVPVVVGSVVVVPVVVGPVVAPVPDVPMREPPVSDVPVVLCAHDSPMAQPAASPISISTVARAARDLRTCMRQDYRFALLRAELAR